MGIVATGTVPCATVIGCRVVIEWIYRPSMGREVNPRRLVEEGLCLMQLYGKYRKGRYR